MNNLMNTFRQVLTLGNNPQIIMQKMIQQNPQLQILQNQMINSGMTPQQFIMQCAKQNNMNIDFNAINNLMQNMRGLIK